MQSPDELLSPWSLFWLSHDWRIVHGIPQWLPAHIYIPAEAKALPSNQTTVFHPGLWFCL